MSLEHHTNRIDSRRYPMVRFKAPAFLLMLVVIPGAAGCGDSKHAPVSGRVLVDGKPKKDLIVLFQPIGSDENPNPGKGSSGRTDEDGRYTLTVDDSTSGAVVGKHRVAIFTALADSELRIDPETGSEDGAAPPKSKESIPPKYNDMTELTYEVSPEGTDRANFDLKTK
jgi:hypothetical protein